MHNLEWSDTSAEADLIQHQIWARMSATERSARTLALSQMLLESSRRVLDERYKDATERERIVLYVAAQYGDDLAEKVRAKLLADNCGRR